MSTMQQTTVNSQPSTSTTTSTSTYAFVPSTAAACGSELLYLAKVYNESLQMYSEQISNELDAQLSFATSAAKELKNQGQDALNSALAQGIGQIGQGALDIGSGAAMNSFQQEAPEEPELNETNRNTTLQDHVDNEPASIEMTTFRNSASEEQVEENEELQTESERTDKQEKTTKAQTRYEQSKLSEGLRGLGLISAGTGSILQGIYQNAEKNHAAAEKLDEYGQSSAKTMSDQFIQQFNAIVSSLNQVYASLVQIAQSNNSR